MRVAGRDVAHLHRCRRKGRGRGRECRDWKGMLRMRCGWLGSGRGGDGDRRWGGSSSRFTPRDGGWGGWRRAGVDELGMFKGEHVDDACPEVWPGLRSFATKADN